MTEPLSLVLLFVTGVAASSLNAVAGGGTFIAFPVLVALGANELVANATCSAALWLGGLASAVGYAERLTRVRKLLERLLLPSAIGSCIGAWLLTVTSQRAFQMAVPALVLMATLLLALQPLLHRRVIGAGRRLPVWVGMALQVLICIYGGYFGAGMGILMIAVMGLIVEADLNELNGLKSALALLVNVLATAAFLYRGLVLLVPTLALGAGALVGGYLSARGAQKVAPGKLRIFIVLIGLGLSVWFGLRAF